MSAGPGTDTRPGAPPGSAERPAWSGRRARVGVDFHTFEGLWQGSRARLLELFRRLLPRALVAGELDFVLFTADPEGLRAALGELDPTRVRIERLASRGPLGRLVRELPRLARTLELDLFHAQYILPRSLRCLRVVTIHDILFESHPELFSRPFVLRSRLLTRRSALRADHVVTVSPWSAREIRTRYGVGEARLTVSPNAVDRTRFTPGALDPSRLARRGLAPGRYVLTVGRIDRRKNLETLLAAHAGARCAELPLVVVGRPADGLAERVLERAVAGDGGRVLHLLDVGDDELPGLYAGAAVFAFPSLAEGFGIPVLEAMAAGVPVVCSNRTALPWVAGEGALLVDPDDVEALRNALDSAWSDDTLRSHLVRAGLRRSEDFSWDAEAERVYGIYARLLSREPLPRA